MPFFVKTEIRNSGIQGKGVFAFEDIPKGTTIWILDTDKQTIPTLGYDSQKNISYTKQQLEEMDQQRRAKVLHFGIYDPYLDIYWELRDGDGFINHSSNPNCTSIYPESKIYSERMSVAIRDISKGEELTQNYNEYPFQWPAWLYKMMEKDLQSRYKFEQNLLIQKNKSSNK